MSVAKRHEPCGLELARKTFFHCPIFLVPVLIDCCTSYKRLVSDGLRIRLDGSDSNRPLTSSGSFRDNHASDAKSADVIVLFVVTGRASLCFTKKVSIQRAGLTHRT